MFQGGERTSSADVALTSNTPISQSPEAEAVRISQGEIFRCPGHLGTAQNGGNARLEVRLEDSFGRRELKHANAIKQAE